MKSKLNPRDMMLALTLTVVAVLGATIAKAETIKKLHSSPQLIINATKMNNVTEADSTIIDLSGGDLDKCSFAVFASSADGTGTLSLALWGSPNGGTNYVATGDTISVSTSPTIGTALTGNGTWTDNQLVSPATKLKLVPTISGSTTFYALKVWALPSVD
jgi:hypothetical protein